MISYEKHAAGLVALQYDDLQVQIATAVGLDKGEYEVGQKLARQLSAESGDTLLLFYDSVRQPPLNDSPPVLNSSIPLINGIEAGIGTKIPIVGGGTLSDHGFPVSIQFAGDSVQSQSASAALLRGNFHTDVKIMHGCSPKDGIYHTITKIEGPVIYEIDNRPAVEVINDIYGNEDWQKQIPLKRLTIGVIHGERFWQEFAEQEYVNRLIVGTLPDKSGIVIFEADFEVGTEFLFMLRDPAQMVESAAENTKSLVQEILNAGKTPIWGFYVDCGGRSAEFSEILEEEAAEVQNILGEYNIPLLGFYSGVEIAPFLNKNRGLDWTGVLTIFSV